VLSTWRSLLTANSHEKKLVDVANLGGRRGVNPVSFRVNPATSLCNPGFVFLGRRVFINHRVNLGLTRERKKERARKKKNRRVLLSR